MHTVMALMQATSVSDKPSPGALGFDQLQVLLNMVIGAGIPMIVALVTHRDASAKVKTACFVVASALGSALAQTMTDNLDWKTFLIAFVGLIIEGYSVHAAVLRPTGVTSSSGVIMTQVATGGIGKPKPVAKKTAAKKK